MTPDEHVYYAAQSTISDPGEYARLLDALPSDPARLVEAVSGLGLHSLFVARLGITPDPGSADDAESRTTAKIIARIVARDEAPLDVVRPPERRFIGICRDYALVACAALRHRGVPARLRAGFATYFAPSFHDDHWVCEYHTDGRWRLLDPQLGERVRAYFRIAFSPADVPRAAFLVAGETWRRVRRGALDPASCGVHAHGLSGPWFIAGNVLKDLAALNKREMLGWEYWGLTRDLSPWSPRISEESAARLDAVAAVIAGPELDWKALREVYERDDALRVPPVVKSFGPTGPKEVAVPA